MILEKLTYPFIFDGSESESFSICQEDVFYLNKGKKYKQFYKGQLIPSEIFDVLFKKNNEIEVSEEIEIIDTSNSEQLVPEHLDENSKLEKSFDSEKKPKKQSKRKSSKKVK